MTKQLDNYTSQATLDLTWTINGQRYAKRFDLRKGMNDATVYVQALQQRGIAYRANVTPH